MSQSTPSQEALPHFKIIDLRVAPSPTSTGRTPSPLPGLSAAILEHAGHNLDRLWTQPSLASPTVLWGN